MCTPLTGTHALHPANEHPHIQPANERLTPTYPIPCTPLTGTPIPMWAPRPLAPSVTAALEPGSASTRRVWWQQGTPRAHGVMPPAPRPPPHNNHPPGAAAIRRGRDGACPVLPAGACRDPPTQRPAPAPHPGHPEPTDPTGTPRGPRGERGRKEARGARSLGGYVRTGAGSPTAAPTRGTRFPNPRHSGEPGPAAPAPRRDEGRATGGTHGQGPRARRGQDGQGGGGSGGTAGRAGGSARGRHGGGTGTGMPHGDPTPRLPGHGGQPVLAPITGSSLMVLPHSPLWGHRPRVRV